MLSLYEDSKGGGTCKGCGAGLDWYKTVAGKNMPMNAGAVPLSSENEASTLRVVVHFENKDSHWASCPNRKQFKS